MRNSLEIYTHLVKKLLARELKNKPNGGLIVDEDSKMSYKQALQYTTMLNDYFGYKGCYSIGICKYCRSWNNRGHTNKCFGSCGSKVVHSYDTCSSWEGK